MGGLHSCQCSTCSGTMWRNREVSQDRFVVSGQTPAAPRFREQMHAHKDQRRASWRTGVEAVEALQSWGLTRCAV